VQLPVDNAESELVIEAVCKSLDSSSYVLLSKTIGLYDDPSSIPVVSGALVKVIDESGVEFVFAENPDELGRYENPSFSVLPNRNYKLEVAYDEGFYSAESRSLTLPQIDSLFVVQDAGGVGSGGDTTNYLIYTVSDNPDEQNYYRFVLWVNGVQKKEVFIETDDLGNGETYTSPFFGVTFDSGDEVYGELWSMNKQTYSYFSAFFTNLNQGPFSAAPSDLPSNLSDGKGYFGVVMVDTTTIIIP